MEDYRKFNYFMTEAPIIQKPVHWFNGKNGDILSHGPFKCLANEDLFLTLAGFISFFFSYNIAYEVS